MGRPVHNFMNIILNSKYYTKIEKDREKVKRIILEKAIRLNNLKCINVGDFNTSLCSTLHHQH